MPLSFVFVLISLVASILTLAWSKNRVKRALSWAFIALDVLVLAAVAVAG